MSLMQPSELESLNQSPGNVHTAASSSSQSFGSSTDPTSSLRAAALLTLKSKRRKPTADQKPISSILSGRPPPPDTSFQLDYGQEDVAISPPVPVIPPATPLVKTPLLNMEDGQVREEGEISDEEEAPPPPDTNPVTLKDSAGAPPSHELDSKTVKALTPSRSIIPKVELTSPNLSDRPATFPHAFALSGHFGELNPLEQMNHLLNADHIRPGLAMNQAQYDTAKDIVLDLLGWGVPPEYLVECGLSREIVYYVFSELNLRLPQNLDVIGLIPYPPTPEFLGMSYRESSMPPPPVRLEAGSHHPQGHPSLPPKPLVTDTIMADESARSPATSQASATTLSVQVNPTAQAPVLTTESLHDMERQRKQELMARRAVQASRKLRQSAALDLPPTTSPPFAAAANIHSSQDVEMASLVPADTVEDFLNSIGPVPETESGGKSSSTTPNAREEEQGVDDMVVDEIPGLGRSRSTHSILAPPPVRDHTPPSNYMVVLPTTSTSTLHEPPLTSEGSHASASDRLTPTLSPSEQPADTLGQQRRGLKRPVASDFVDLEPGPRGYGNGTNGNGYINGNGSFTHLNHPIKRKTNSFAGVSGMRRCVIDLSDSEGEDGDDVSMHDLGEYDRGRSGYASPAQGRPVSIVPSIGGWATPPAPAPSSSTSGAMTPAVLMEKELEIRRMRELIAQREQNRLKKAALSRSLSSLESNTRHETPMTISIPVKEEDDEPHSGPLSSSSDTNKYRHLNGHRSRTPQEEAPDTLVPQVHNDRQRPTSTDPTSFVAGAASTSSSVSASATSSIIDDDDCRNVGTPHHDDSTLDLASTREHPGLLTAEARHEEAEEQVISNPSASSSAPADREDHELALPDGLVDVDLASSSSTQVSKTPAPPRREENQALRPRQEANENGYATYDSPFESYPLLRLHSRPVMFSGDTTTTFDPSSFLSSSSGSLRLPTSSPLPFPLPNLKPLKLATASKMLDPSKRICQYEVPGGGVCRDEGCEDVHLGRMGGGGERGLGGVEPTDEETAEYLYSGLPAGWARGVSASKISSALQQARVEDPAMDIEARVVHALAAALGQAGPAPT